MPQGTTVLALSLAYLGLLFAIAHLGERHAKRWSQSRLGPIVYGLSFAIYCTSWTFYGSVGRAATAGPDFILIYVGPSLMMLLGYPAMAKMIAAAKRENVTSIADFLASRYGKSRAVAVVATLIALVGVVPYIALQLQAMTFSFDALIGHRGDLPLSDLPLPLRDTALVVAVVMAAFTILFGVRNIHASEQHRGMMLAIAFESIIKLVAFVAVGLFVVYGLFEGWGDLRAQVEQRPAIQASLEGRTPATGWIVMTALAGLAFLCLPRQFHVAVVEHDHPRSLKTARWLFPLYLVLINLFVVPIAAAGLLKIGAGADPDLFVLSLPLQAGWSWLSVLAFIGGLSAATSMIIVAAVALSGMIGNELVMPILLRRRADDSSSVGSLVLPVRRAAVCLILALAYFYHQAIAGHLPLVSIGLISFCAVANFAPALLLGLYWRGAHRFGVVAGLIGSFAVWIHTLLIPSIMRDVGLNKPPLADWMPDALGGLDFFAQGFLASIAVNVSLLVLVSLVARPNGRDIVQANAFVRGEAAIPMPEEPAHDARLDELRELLARFVGAERAATAFAGTALSVPAALAQTERILAGVIGAASARVVVASAGRGLRFSLRSTRAILGEASEAIRNNYELLRKTLDNVGTGIATFDRSGALLVWNERFERMLALPEGAAHVGARIADLAALAPDLAEIAASGGRAAPIERRGPDGGVAAIGVDPLPDGGFVLTVSDVTERVRAAEAIRDRERRIRVYTDNVPVLISYIDRDQRYRFINRPYQAALRLPEREIEGRHLVEVLGEERYARLRRFIEGALSGEPQVFEIEFPTNDAKIEVARGTYIPHIDDAGEVIGFFVLYQDITERRRAEAALRQAAETLERRVAERTAELESSRAEAEAANLGKTRFIAAASHDLLQPLHAARLFAATLAERQPDDELVGKIDKGLASVEALLSALLDISRLDSATLKPDRQAVPLGPLLADLVATLAPVAQRRGASLKLVGTSAVVATDPVLLRRILQNLISNALRYGGGAGRAPRVVVGCRHAGGAIRIEVCDNGPGIPEDKRHAVFEEFTRLAGPIGDPAQDRGLGLGLAIVERMASVLDHPVELRSEAGRGSTFAVTVPAAESQVVALRPAYAPAESTQAPTAAFALCIDDEASVREGMETLLQAWGCSVAVAAGLDEAIAALGEPPHRPDVLLVDLHLAAGENGFEVIAALRRRLDAPIPAAIITADRGPEIRAKARTHGIDVLLKPVRPAALRALLAQRTPRRTANAAE